MMTIGLDVPSYVPESPARTYQDLARAAEQAGFDRLWVGDHLLWRQPRFETFGLLALLAGTTGLGLGTAVALAPLRPPWWLAKQAATLHALAPGGFILGLGTGGEYEPEYAMAEVPLEERGTRLDQAIQHCCDAWGGRLGEDVSPRPATPIPIWVGGRKGAALRRAAQRADGWLGLFLTPEAFASRRDTILARRPSDLPPLSTAMAIWACVDDDADRAHSTALRVISQEYGMAARPFESYVVAGTPASVADQVAAYAAVGVDHVEVHIAHPDARAQIATWGSEVLPRLR